MTLSVDDQPRAWQKALLLSVALLAIAHTVVIALWLAPSSPIRDSVGATNLSTYIDPYFQQSWTSMDPQSQRVDESLQFRAQVLDVNSEKKKITKWFDVTSAKRDVVQHGVLRGGFELARIDLAARRLATNLTAATFAMGDARSVAADDYVKKPSAELPGDLRKAGASRADVTNYVAFNQMTVEFLSMYAAAQSDDEVLAIQYRVGRRIVESYDRRDQKQFEDTPFTYVTHGWRRGFTAQFEAQQYFDSHVGN